MNTVEKINTLFDTLNQKVEKCIGNTYLLLIDNVDYIEDWLKLWGKNKDGSYSIAGNNTFVIQSPLNILIDISKNFEEALI